MQEQSRFGHLGFEILKPKKVEDSLASWEQPGDSLTKYTYSQFLDRLNSSKQHRLIRPDEYYGLLASPSGKHSDVVDDMIAIGGEILSVSLEREGSKLEVTLHPIIETVYGKDRKVYYDALNVTKRDDRLLQGLVKPESHVLDIKRIPEGFQFVNLQDIGIVCPDLLELVFGERDIENLVRSAIERNFDTTYRAPSMCIEIPIIPGPWMCFTSGMRSANFSLYCGQIDKHYGRGVWDYNTATKRQGLGE